MCILDQNGAKTLPDGAALYKNVVRRALRFTVQCSPLSQVMIPFHLARVTNASMLSLAVYLVHYDKRTEKGFLQRLS